MKIAIIGAGRVGTGLCKHLVALGHEVMLSFSRDSTALQRNAQALGARAGSVDEAARFAELLVLAVPFAEVATALGQITQPAPGTVLWDCTNALTPDMGGLAVGTTWSAGEEVQRLAPWARVVKGIPPFAEVLHAGGLRLRTGAIGVFVCGDDADARAVVAGLLTALGAAATDAGALRNARWAEPAAFLLVQLAYAQGRGARIGLALVHD